MLPADFCCDDIHEHHIWTVSFSRCQRFLTLFSKVPDNCRIMLDWRPLLVLEFRFNWLLLKRTSSGFAALRMQQIVRIMEEHLSPRRPTCTCINPRLIQLVLPVLKSHDSLLPDGLERSVSESRPPVSSVATGEPFIPLLRGAQWCPQRPAGDARPCRGRGSRRLPGFFYSALLLIHVVQFVGGKSSKRNSVYCEPQTSHPSVIGSFYWFSF